jgi:acetyl/propionyl-CoA carboxylase alpha subunit
VRGAAIEARVCAEDPEKRFFPSPGTITKVRFPTMEGVRIDAGVADGSVVSPAYDSLLAKVIAHGRTRDEAIDRLKAAIEATIIEGVKTNLALFGKVLDHPLFRAGTHDTGFLQNALGLKS